MIVNSSAGSKNLNVPTGFDVIKAGNTGLWYDKMFPYKKNEILDYLGGVNYGHKDEDIWDCDAITYYGIANARCKLPGVGIGLAAGRANYPPFKTLPPGVKHSIIIFWHVNGSGEYQPGYFDAAIKREIPSQDFVPDFFVPFPAYRPINPNEKRDINPFTDSQRFPLVACSRAPNVKKGYIILNKDYYFENVDNPLFEDIKNFINTLTTCQQPTDPEQQVLFDRYYSREDAAFWAFIKTRYSLDSEHRSPETRRLPTAMGFALGEKDGEDKAAVAVWKKKNEMVFWLPNLENFPEITFNQENAFNARLIIA